MKKIISLIIVLMLALSLAACGGGSVNSETETGADGTATEENESGTTSETVEETMSETTVEAAEETTTGLDVTYETFEDENGYFTVDIPEGWTAESAGSCLGLVIMIYDTENPTRQVIYCDELQGASNAEDVAKIEESTGVTMAQFSSMKELVERAGETTFGYTDFNQTSTDMRGSNEIVHGTIKYEDITLECMATARLLVLSGATIGDSEVELVFADGFQMITALPEEFATYKPVLLHVLNSLEFTDAYWDAREAEWSEMVGGSSMYTTKDNNIIGIMQ